ncbi:MAG TPA: hypothetical protein VMR86_16490 [Myxococcota bacterium]|nr:hypothetical protein [Myxococcota bacterium]
MHRRIPALLCLVLAASVRAQDGYQQPQHLTEDEIAIAYIAGRFSAPVTCKRQDGSVLQIEDAIELKPAPEAGGGNSLKVTFFGIEVGDVDYCYNLIERRVPDRRGTILLHYRSHNRKDLGSTDFRRSAQSGSLTYNAHEGVLKERPIGSNPDNVSPRELDFGGGDSRLVVEPIQPGSDGAKLYADFDGRKSFGDAEGEKFRRYSFRFIAKDGREFRLYATQDMKHRR